MPLPPVPTHSALARSLLLAAALFVPRHLPAQQTTEQLAQDVRTATTWTVDHLVTSPDARAFRVSPDGRRAVWVRRMPDAARDRLVGHLVLSCLAGDPEVTLTRGPDECTDPKWSPDGRRIAFLSRRPRPGTGPVSAETARQVWLIDPRGGEPWPLTQRPRGVDAFAWTGRDSLLVAAPDDPLPAARTREGASGEDDAVVVDDEASEPAVRLHTVHAVTGKESPVTDNTDRIRAFFVSPDGRHAVTFHERSRLYEFDNRVKPLAFLHDLSTGFPTPIFRDRSFNLEHVVWEPDGRAFLAVTQFTTDPRYVMATVSRLYRYDLASGTQTEVDLAWERGLASCWEDPEAPPVAPLPDGFVALLADGAHFRTARYYRCGKDWRRSPLAGEHAGAIVGLTASADGKVLVYATSTAASPPRWFHARLLGDRLDCPSPLVDLHAAARKRPTARVEVVRWKGANGDEVEGLLHLPPNHDPARRAPLVVLLHGGPAVADHDAWEESWAQPQQLLCQRGALVFRPNYHGSSNYGLSWAESLRGRAYELELTDIETGVDALVARGLADPTRLAVMGRSYGAMLAAALTVHTPRYRAALCTAGTVEQASDWGATDFGAAYDGFYLGRTPFQDPLLYVRKSPYFRLNRVRTPTLIQTGADDSIVGAHQAYLHYRALRHETDTPARLVVYPGEGHNLERLTHQRRKLNEDMAWLDKYLPTPR